MESENSIKEIELILDKKLPKKDLKGPILTLIQRLFESIPDNLESIILIGSSTTEDFHPEKSDINTIIVVKNRNIELLRKLASHGKELGRFRLRAPLVMTERYIAESLDVFGIEFLDFQLNHITLHGKDFLEGINIEKEHVRLQCERDLKSALINLRQGYISSMADPKIIGNIIYNCSKALIFILRAMLWLSDRERPRLIEPTFKAACEEFKIDEEKLHHIIKSLLSRTPISRDIDTHFENIYNTIELLTEKVNTLRASG